MIKINLLQIGPANPFLGTIALAHDSVNCGLVGPLTGARDRSQRDECPASYDSSEPAMEPTSFCLADCFFVGGRSVVGQRIAAQAADQVCNH
ncbi:hypothetical protein [Bradyrhizobium jicamae]|uniref:hypothetical protein n=1 Tax=Bradyrhizobium jicamae TaxID=280332 RepID=UPI0012ECFA01|nr:hypothetical protein [Bradyrhizobium jicamae]